MLWLLMLLQAQGPDIVVNGERLIEAQRKCVVGSCTPLRDAQASIALAEKQFRDGEYLKAKKTLGAAVARNGCHAATDPKPVAAIYEAYATVALHEGDQDIYRRAVAAQVHVLRDHLPADDPAVMSAATALGDMWVKLGQNRQADISYAAAERQAIASGQDATAMIVALKRAWIASRQGARGRAERMLADIGARPIAKSPGFSTVLRVMQLRIAALKGDNATIASLARELGQAQTSAPILLWVPPLTVSETAAATIEADAIRFGEINLTQTPSSDVESIQWADIGFWIRPDGRTTDVEVLRSSQSTPWSGSIIRQIQGRRYAPTSSTTTMGVNAPGTFRVERVTRTSKYTTPLGSNIRRRVPAHGFEILDLTEDGARRPAA